MARYRLRTELRGILPAFMSALAPKGRGDCGDHEWHRADEHTDRCYHCHAGERPHLEPAAPRGEDRVGAGTTHRRARRA